MRLHACLALVLATSAHADLLRERCAWTGLSTDPSVDDVDVTPVVVDLDRDGASDVVFIAHDSRRTPAGVLVAISGSDCRELFAVTDPGCHACVGDTACRQLDANGNGGFLGHGLAAGDLDGDGSPEILAMLGDEGDDHVVRRVIAFNADGGVRWCTAAADIPIDHFFDPFRFGTPSLADLDGDGRPEVLVGARAYDADGNLVVENASFDETFTAAGAADLDRDGIAEIVLGGAALDASGAVVWQRADRFSGGHFGRISAGAAVADLDGDGAPEVVLASRAILAPGPPLLTVLDTSGATLSEVSLPNWPRCVDVNLGIPSIGDVGGDGLPEIALANGPSLCLFDAATLAERWCVAIDDCSPGVLSPSFADVDGDGRDEVLLTEQDAFRVYGGDGSLVQEFASSGYGWHETVVAADVDGDCAGELVFAEADIRVGSTRAGVRIFEGDDAPLPSYRAIWNQHAYHVTNVSDDATIPRMEATPVSSLAQVVVSRAASVTASRAALWPPNHRLVRVALTSDDGSPVRVLSVRQDEPVDDRGDGSHGPDAVIDSEGVLLRAERDGRGDGRTYHLEVAAGSGACAAVSTVTVCVPHDRRPARRRAAGCGDQGPLFDSTVR